MLEVKDKNISCIKISNCIKNDVIKEDLEKEWNRYKFRVLEYSRDIYNLIEDLLIGTDKLNANIFYDLIDVSFKSDLHIENQINTIMEIWNYFKEYKKEAKGFSRRIMNIKDGSSSIKSMKNYLYNLAIKYKIKSLIESYYFAF